MKTEAGGLTLAYKL